MSDIHDYRDIIDLPYKKSKNRPWMSLSQRAGQFAPFAALTGHHEKIQEVEMLRDDWIDLDHQQLMLLDLKLKEALNHPDKPYQLIYYDETLSKYMHLNTKVKQYDEINKAILLDDGQLMPLALIYDIKEAVE